MKLRAAAVLFLTGAASLALGQATMPATRPSTVGAIAAADTDVTPLEQGAAIPKLTLKTSDGQALDLSAAIAKKPAVLIFYRGGWCPYCMRQLSGMEGVVDDLKDVGYQLIAISPDKPEELAKTVHNESLTYTLLSDSDAAAIKAFGLAFQAAPTQFTTLEQYSGQTHHAIPIPAVYIVSADGKIQFAHHDPDYKVRMNPSEVVEKAKAVQAK